MMWFFVTVLSLAVGGAVGFALMWVWFFVRVIFLGYGDSGPSWINTVSDVVIAHSAESGRLFRRKAAT